MVSKKIPNALSALAVLFVISGCVGGGGQQVARSSSTATDIALGTSFTFNKHVNATIIQGPAINVGSLFVPEYHLWAFHRSVPLDHPVLQEIVGSSKLHMIVIKLAVAGIRYGDGWSNGASFRFWDGMTTIPSQTFRQATLNGFDIQLPNRAALSIPKAYMLGFSRALPCAVEALHCIGDRDDMNHWMSYMKQAIVERANSAEAAESILDPIRKSLEISA